MPAGSIREQVTKAGHGEATKLHRWVWITKRCLLSWTIGRWSRLHSAFRLYWVDWL